MNTEEHVEVLKEIQDTLNRLGIALCAIAIGMFVIFLSTGDFKKPHTYTRDYRADSSWEVVSDVESFIKTLNDEDQAQVVDVEYYTIEDYGTTEYGAMIVYNCYHY